VRAVPGAVVTFAAASAAGAPTRTSGHSPRSKMRFGPAILKAMSFQLAGKAKITWFCVLRYAMGPAYLLPPIAWIE
jgi:hypothetical protein